MQAPRSRRTEAKVGFIPIWQQASPARLQAEQTWAKPLHLRPQSSQKMLHSTRQIPESHTYTTRGFVLRASGCNSAFWLRILTTNCYDSNRRKCSTTIRERRRSGRGIFSEAPPQTNEA